MPTPSSFSGSCCRAGRSPSFAAAFDGSSSTSTTRSGCATRTRREASMTRSALGDSGRSSRRATWSSPGTNTSPPRRKLRRPRASRGHPDMRRAGEVPDRSRRDSHGPSTRLDRFAEHASRTGAIHAVALGDRARRSRDAAQADLRSVHRRSPNLPVDECVWSEETEAAEIASADVGISWVPDDPWSRGKCGLKVLQYQAAGLPVIANPVGVHVADGPRRTRPASRRRRPRNGSLRLSRLAADPSLRRRLGARARRQVEERYSVAAGARRWLTALDRLAHPLRKSG